MKNMFSLNNIYMALKYVLISLFILGLILVCYLLYNIDSYLCLNFKYKDQASLFAAVFGGVIGPMFTLVSVLVIVLVFLKGNIDKKKEEVERNFFKMVDFHNIKVSSISAKDISGDGISEGQRAFVVFRLQLLALINVVEKINISENLNLNKREILDIVYISFYYGLDANWKTFISKKLKRYSKHTRIVDLLIREIEDSNKSGRNIGRTNQTFLSTYFRNMYHTIKYIHNSEILSKDKKKEYIRIYRAQLSNPELYVIYINIVSRFGKKWEKNKYITKYEFLKNIPFDYCKGYEPRDFFDMTYEEDEIYII